MLAQPHIAEIAAEWLALDRDPSTRQEITDLLERRDANRLEERLRHRMIFGTAGLRAPMGAGYSRMNALTVIQTSQGIAKYLLAEDPECQDDGVVIGRDGRHNSEKFALLAASAFMDEGFHVYYLDQVHTPMVPFVLERREAAAGIMITASHNPATDNGYKVYWNNSCQIIPPIDKGIADAIEENLEPQRWTLPSLETDPLNWDEVGPMDEIMEYAAALELIVRGYGWSDSTSVEFVYTPLHGVGLEVFDHVLTRLVHEDDMHVVYSQAQPDPDFPTLHFPNPEERGALDAAIETADEKGIELILATDPDADRFAVAEKVDGEWKQLTGNQVGILLAMHILEAELKDPENTGLMPCMLTSAVSSRMLSSVAARDGKFHFEETLTGFKWLGNRSHEIDQARQYRPVFAYEEAIGYMFPALVNDKDGVAAAIIFLAACHCWKQKGLTPWTRLQQLYRDYGYFQDANTYLTSPSPAVTERVFKVIRDRQPTSVGTRRIMRLRDLTVGYDSGTRDRKPVLPVDTTAQMITVELEGGIVCTARGSGTEPKIKLYVEAVSSSPTIAKDEAKSVLRDLIHEWFPMERWGLRPE